MAGQVLGSSKASGETVDTSAVKPMTEARPDVLADLQLVDARDSQGLGAAPRDDGREVHEWMVADSEQGDSELRRKFAGVALKVLGNHLYPLILGLGCLAVCFAEVISEALNEPFPSADVLWAVAGPVAVALLADSALHALVGTSAGVPELLAPGPLIMDLIPPVLILTWPALHHLNYAHPSWDDALRAGDLKGFLDDVAHTRSAVTFILLPSAFVKIVSACWRHAIMARVRRDWANSRRSKLQRPEGAQGGGRPRLKINGEDSSALRAKKWSEWLMMVTALSCLCLMLMKVLQDMLPNTLMAFSDQLGRYPTLVEEARAISPNGAAEDSALAVAFAEPEASELTGGPLRLLTHVYVRKEGAEGQDGDDPDAYDLILLREHRAGSVLDGLRSPEPAMWTVSTRGTVLCRYLYREIFMDDIDTDAQRKAIMLAVCGLLLLSIYYFAGMMMVRPMRQLFAALASSTSLLSLTGAEGVPMGSENPTSIEEAIGRVLHLMSLLQKASMGGNLVVQQLMDQAAHDAAEGNTRAITAAKHWARMFEGAPDAIPSETGSRVLDTQSQGTDPRAERTASEHSTNSNRGGGGRGMAWWLSRRNVGGAGGSRDGDSSACEESAVEPMDAVTLPDALMLGWGWSSIGLETEALIQAVMGMFGALDLLTNEPIMTPEGQAPQKKVHALVRKLCRGYLLDNPYHNWEHAVDVTHGMFLILRNAKELRKHLDKSDHVALMLAAIAHDVGHRGTSNAFLVATDDPLALMYNDMAVQENMHAASLFKMMRDPQTNPLDGVPRERRRKMRTTIVDAILGTDMAIHFDLTAAVEVLADARALSSTEELTAKQHRVLIQTLLHFADLSYLLKSRKIVLEWTERVVKEFFSQGQRERGMGLPSLPLMQASRTHVPSTQMDFMDFVVRPFCNAVAGLLPSLAPDIRFGLLSTFHAWVDVCHAQQIEAGGHAAQSGNQHRPRISSERTGSVKSSRSGSSQQVEALAGWWTTTGVGISAVPAVLQMDLKARLRAFKNRVVAGEFHGEPGRTSNDSLSAASPLSSGLFEQRTTSASLHRRKGR
ncbi:unnamed protein product [Pedinophyceae sp. YPF-701]|nr:unnamed protein product [Pedinophyceae sp. YPF-701]